LEEAAHVLWHFYFALADAAAYYAAVKDKASIAWPLQQMPYG